MLKKSRTIFNAFLNLGLITTVFFHGIPAIADDYPTGTVTVIKTVINNNGGTKQSSDFTIKVVGLSGVPAPGGGDPDTYSSSFPGDASGTPVLLGAGFYDITEIEDPAYEVDYSPECSSNESTPLGSGQTRTCIITNTDKPGKLNVVVNVVNDDGGVKTADLFSVNIVTPTSTSTISGSEAGSEVSLHAGGYYVTLSPDSGYAYDYSDSCTGNITIGQSITCTVTVNDIAGSSGGGGGSGTSTPSSNLSLTKIADKSSSIANDTIIYTLTVTNNGPDTASSVIVTDLLPTDLTYITSVASLGSYDSVTGVWTVGDLVNGQSETLTLTATVNLNVQNTNIVNSASASSSVTDPDSVDNSASSTVGIPPNSGGGSGGGGSSGGGSSSGGSGIPTPPSGGSGSGPGSGGTTGGQVAGVSTTTISSISMPVNAEEPTGKVLGAATTLPVTGLPVIAYSVLGFVSLAAAIKFGKK